MRTSTTAALLLAALLLPAAGCTRLFDASALDPLDTASGYCRAWRDANYGWRARCEGYDPDFATFSATLDHEQRCVAIAGSVAAGRMAYNRTAGEACLAGLRGDTCGQYQVSWRSACEEALAPAVAQDGACTRYDECLAPAQCTFTTDPCHGTCLWTLLPGAACGGASNQPCGTGLACFNGTCGARPGPGEACPDGVCLESLQCIGGACTYLAALGESCDPAGISPACDPAQALYCDPAWHTCAPLPASGSCAPGNQCAPGHFCTATSLCIQTPTAPQANGDVCGSPLFCDYRSFCDTAQSPPRCVAQKTAGRDCVSQDQCLAPLICDWAGGGAVGTCQLRKVAGATCWAGFNECLEGLACRVAAGAPLSGGRCQPTPDLGQPCDTGYYQDTNPESMFCRRGFCDYNLPGGSAGTCTAPRPAGGHCENGEYCQSGLCDQATLLCLAPACP